MEERDRMIQWVFILDADMSRSRLNKCPFKSCRVLRPSFKQLEARTAGENRIRFPLHLLPIPPASQCGGLPALTGMEIQKDRLACSANTFHDVAGHHFSHQLPNPPDFSEISKEPEEELASIKARALHPCEPCPNSTSNSEHQTNALL